MVHLKTTLNHCMEAFLVFFEDMPSWQKLVWVIVCLSFAWTLEAVLPLAKHDYKKIRHDSINLTFLSFSLIINILVGGGDCWCVLLDQ